MPSEKGIQHWNVKKISSRLHRAAFALDKVPRDILRLVIEKWPDDARKLHDALLHLDFYRREIEAHLGVAKRDACAEPEAVRSAAAEPLPQLPQLPPLTIETVDRLARECGGRRVREIR